MVLYANVHVAGLVSLYAPTNTVTVLPLANIDAAVGLDEFSEAVKCIVEEEAGICRSILEYLLAVAVAN